MTTTFKQRLLWSLKRGGGFSRRIRHSILLPCVAGYDGVREVIGGIGLILLGLLRLAFVPYGIVRNLLMIAVMPFWHAIVQKELAEEKIKAEEDRNTLASSFGGDQ